MLSGSLIPRPMARLEGSSSSNVDAVGRDGGVVSGVLLNAAYTKDPSGLKALPPTLASVLKLPESVNGAFAVLSCASTVNVAVSYSVNPAMNLEPSGDIAITDDWPFTVRLRRIWPEATSNTYRIVWVALLTR